MPQFLIEHEHRRQAGRATVSALRGPLAAAVGCWRAWCRAAERPAVVVPSVDPEQWSAGYVEAFLRHCRPRQTAEAALLQRAGREPGTFSPSQLSLHQLQLLFENAGLGDGNADRLCRGLLESFARGETVTAPTVAQWFAKDLTTERWLALFKAIVEFLPVGTLLQQHGFFVLRFLAEDVVTNIELICQSIRSIVQLRDE